MYIRQARLEDVANMMVVFDQAKEIMRSFDNYDQWGDDYPKEVLIEKDIKLSQSYVVIADDQESDQVEPGEIIGTFVLQRNEDENYNNILEGDWLNDDPYVVVHRVASSDKIPGVGNFMFQHWIQNYDNIRIDTSEKNKPMLALVRKYNFKYCTVIDLGHDTRLGFQYLAPSEKN